MSGLPYRMEQFSREVIAAADPFCGRGVFLEARGSREEMLGRLSVALGVSVPAVAWDDVGVWVDPGSSGMSAAVVRGRWDGGKASERG